MHDNDTPKKLYVLYSGEYSGRSAIAAYATMERAYAAMDVWARREPRSGYDIEELEFEPETPDVIPDRDIRYSVAFDSTGEVSWVMVEPGYSWSPTQNVHDYIGGGMNICLNAKSWDHAVKAAAEIRAHRLAEREGIA